MDDKIVFIQKKVKQPYFFMKWSGLKPWEIRIEDDVKFVPGMIIKNVEIDKDGIPTGFFIYTKVLFVLRDFPGLTPGYCIYSEEILEKGGLTS